MPPPEVDSGTLVPSCAYLKFDATRVIATRSDAIFDIKNFERRSRLIIGKVKHMFCDGCGGAVQPGQAFCSRCGKQVVGPVTALQPYPKRVQAHIHLLSILWLAMSAFNAVGGVVLLIVANTLFGHSHPLGAPNASTFFLRPLLSVVAMIILAKSAFGFIAGWGLMHREPWARVLTLVLAFVSLFHIPFGTAIGAYTLWVLLPSQSQQEYDALIDTRAA